MKLKSGYLDALPKLVQPDDRTRPHVVQPGGRRHREAVEQQPESPEHPDADELGREIRKAFVAEEGRVLLSADYSQIELRIMAHLSGDANLREAFEQAKDFHRSTAALIFGKDEGDVDARGARLGEDGRTSGSCTA